MPAPRSLLLLLFLFCCGLMAYGFYLEYVEGLEPCPLCMTQRLFIVLCGALGLLAFLHNPAALGLKIYAFFITLSGLLGAATAGRQLWLQSLPADQVPACGPSLGYMFEVLPFTDALKTLMMGDGNCAEVVWTFLGLSMPGWTLICFSGFALFGFWHMLRKPQT